MFNARLLDSDVLHYTPSSPVQPTPLLAPPPSDAFFPQACAHLPMLFLPGPPTPPFSPAFPPVLSTLPVTCVAQRGIFIQGKERWVQQDRVVVLHDNALVLRLDPRLVLVSWPHPREKRDRELTPTPRMLSLRTRHPLATPFPWRATLPDRKG